MTVALYARVSSQRQTNTQTIDQQLDRLRARAEECGAPSTACLVFRDDGYSGASLRRPGLDALRDAVACAEVERILITAPDRLARKYVHQVLLLEELERFGCVVEFLDRPMSADPHDQLLLQIRGAVAEYERTLIAERMRRGRLAKLRSGTLLPWTCVPYGYRVDSDRPRDPSRVQIDPAEGTVIQEIFARYLADGATLGTVAAALEQHGTHTAHGRRHWSRSTLRWMLHNPVYLGQVYAYRTYSRPARKRQSPLRPVGRQGTTLELAARDTWLLVATIPPIISQELFDHAQAKLAENQQRARRHLITGQYLLRALVSCGVCGYTCKGRPEAPRYAYYVCAGKVPGRPEHPEGRCPARYIPAHPLDDLVWRDLCEVLTHPNSIAQALERAQSGAWLPQELQARRTQLQSGIEHLARQVERVGDAYQAGAMPLAEYRHRRQALDERLRALERQRQQLEAHVDQHQAVTQVMASIAGFCEQVQQGLAQATFAQRRQLVELLIDRVIVTNGDVEIRYVIPTSPASVHVRFSHLRTNYFSTIFGAAPLRGRWTVLFTALHYAERQRLARDPHPSAAIMDAQSVKTVEESAHISGFHAHKRVKGRKRHLLVDTLGIPVSYYVTPANMHDTQGARRLLAGLKYFVPRLKTIWADQAYQGQELVQWCKAVGGWDLEVVGHVAGTKGFAVRPKRWIVERTFGWLSRYRRMSKDYERKVQTSEALIELAMIRLLLARLGRRIS